MPSGDEGELTVTVRVRVSPEPEQEEALLGLMRRYRDALNYSIRAIIANRALSLGKAHKLLYNDLRERYGLPSNIAVGCYREAIAIAKSWLRNPRRGNKPTARAVSLLVIDGWFISYSFVHYWSGLLSAPKDRVRLLSYC
jgi:predicted transposase